MNLLKSSMVLSFARLTNYLVMLLSPLLLVRLLDIETYGHYREFLLYSSVLISLFVLAIKDNLIYIIPKHHDRAQIATSQTVGMLMVTTVIGTAIFLAGAPWFMAKASFDFAVPLALYVFLFINLDVLENYWLATQQPRMVMLFSTARVALRVTSVLVAAAAFRDFWSIIYTIIAFEAIKAVFCLAILLRLKLLVLQLDRDLLREQLRFILPLSCAGLIYFVNEKAGQLYISASMGAAALAIYTIGTYQLPITAIVRSAVADSLFPDMVKHGATGSQQGLELWKRANSYYCFLVFPIFMVLFVYADLFVVTLFTAAYQEATNVFRVALVVMVRQCFEMGTPLRAVNANRHMLAGNVFAVIVHLPMLYLLSEHFGIVGTAIAWLIADFLAASYLARKIVLTYGIGVSGLAHWGDIFKLLLSALLALPILFLGQALEQGGMLVAAISSVVYLVAFVFVVRHSKVIDVDQILGKLVHWTKSKLRRTKATS